MMQQLYNTLPAGCISVRTPGVIFFVCSAGTWAKLAKETFSAFRQIGVLRLCKGSILTHVTMLTQT